MLKSDKGKNISITIDKYPAQSNYYFCCGSLRKCSIKAVELNNEGDERVKVQHATAQI